MPPKDKIAADCPMWQLLTKAIDDTLRKNLDPLLEYTAQFDSSVQFDELDREEDGVQYFKKATITMDGWAFEMFLPLLNVIHSSLPVFNPLDKHCSLCNFRAF